MDIDNSIPLFSHIVRTPLFERGIHPYTGPTSISTWNSRALTTINPSQLCRKLQHLSDLLNHSDLLLL